MRFAEMYRHPGSRIRCGDENHCSAAVASGVFRHAIAVLDPLSCLIAHTADLLRVQMSWMGDHVRQTIRHDGPFGLQGNDA